MLNNNYGKTKKILALLLLIAFATSGLFAADVDNVLNGVKELFTNAKSLMIIIGGCLLAYSLIMIILKIIGLREMDQRDWRQVFFCLLGGIALTSIGTILVFLLGDTTANALGITA